MTNLKIVFVLNSFFPESCAGTEVYVLELARYLRGRGHFVSILIPSLVKSKKKYEYDDFKVYQYPASSKPTVKELNGQIPPSGIDIFKEILVTVKPDIVHFHLFNRAINSFNIKIAKDLGIKTVFTSHLAGLFCMRGDLFYKNKNVCDGKVRLQRCLSCYIHRKTDCYFLSDVAALSINTLLFCFPFIKNFKPFFFAVKKKKIDLKLLAKYTDRIISISKWMLDVYSINGINKTVPICQEIEEKMIRGITSECYNKERITLIFVGRLYPIKNIELLLDCLALMDRDKIDLTIVGLQDKNSINYYHGIKNKYERLGYNKWYENLPKASVLKLLKSADMLCLTSKSEVAPLVIKEAFDCGVPVLGSDIPPVSELVSHAKNGLLFEADNLNSLKEQLDMLISEKKLLNALKENVRPMTDIVKVYKLIEKQYKLLMSSY